MLIVIPVSHVDEHMAGALLDHLASPEDSARQFPALLVLSRTVADPDTLREKAEKAFASVSAVMMETEYAGGWPLAANRMFQFAVRTLARTGNKRFWYWLEADNVPTRRSWLTDLATEYNQNRKPFMGPKEPTRMNDRQGNFVRYEGFYINGSAIYPVDFHRWSTLWEYASQEPWDLYCRWEIFPKAHVSSLMTSRWSSSNYRLEDGKLFFDSRSSHSNQDPIDPEKVAVIHGCKDSSLLDILWRKEAPIKHLKVREVEEVKEVVATTPTPTAKRVIVLEDD
jgi:hypothetical protein